MRYLSVCSGIEAASVAWEPIGWEPVAFSEIEPFPSAVLHERFPGVPNLGDMTRYREWGLADFDVLVGGTPCQSFSVAGLRRGLADPRGNLALVFLGLLDRFRPRWVVWENVPGVLSSNHGRDFGAFVGGLAELGYGWAYRVLDAQYVRVESHARAVPQRRRRVFVVGHLGDWRPAAAVLLERESLSGHPAPRRTAGEGTARESAPSLTGSGRGVGRVGESRGQDPLVAHAVPIKYRGDPHEGTDTLVASTLLTEGDAHSGYRDEHGLVAPSLSVRNSGAHGVTERGDLSQPLVTHSLRADGFDASEDGTGRGTPLVFDTTQITSKTNRSHPLAAGAHAPAGNNPGVRNILPSVRRLTPRECERLQGFPDDYTDIPWRGKPNAPDGPRYRALGNSMAVNVMAWIGRRISATRDTIRRET